MSTRILALCWPLQMPPAQKAVLIALADQANDSGVCWPAVGTISERTCICERAVRNALRALSKAGFVVATERPGRSTYYTLNPGTACSPAADAALHEMPGRGALDAGEGGTTCRGGGHDMPLNRKGTINEPSKNQKKETVPQLPEWMPAEIWDGWIEHRRAMGKRLTLHAQALQLRKLGELFDQGHNPIEIVEASIAGGWLGLFGPKTGQSEARVHHKSAAQRQAEAIFRITGGLAGAPAQDGGADVELFDRPRIA